MSSFAPPSPSPSLVLFSCLLLFLSSTATAFNITRILEKNSDFSNFNQYLSQTNLAKEINRRSTITVLAVNNGAISSISDRSPEVIKRILSNHVVLDYYDIPKLQKLKGKSDTLTTLFQSSGVANNRQGFLNVSNSGNGNIVFGSTVKGAPQESRLVNLVAAQPFNISVLEVSSVIIAPGIDGNFTIPPLAAPSPAPLKAKSPRKARAPVADSPDEESDDTTPTPAPTPTPSDAPESRPAPDVVGPTSDTPADVEASPPSSWVSRTVPSVGDVMVYVLALLVVFLNF